jgi:hypothetical protein
MNENRRADAASSRLRQIIPGVVTMEATESATIVVTAEDIAEGVPADPRNCALAIASRRTWGEGGRVYFNRGIAYVTFTDRQSRPHAERFVLPKATREMIRRFDRGDEIEPGAYELRAPAPSATVAACHERAKAQREAARREGRPIRRAPRGPHDPLSYKRRTIWLSEAPS